MWIAVECLASVLALHVLEIPEWFCVSRKLENYEQTIFIICLLLCRNFPRKRPVIKWVFENKIIGICGGEPDINFYSIIAILLSLS